MIKLSLRIVALLLTVILLSACSQPAVSSSEPEPPEPFPVEINGTVIESEPQRIVSLSPSLTEMLYDLGELERLVARSDFCIFPGTAQSLPSAGTALFVDVDMISELDADLVLTSSSLSEPSLQELKEAGITVVTLEPPLSPEELPDLYSQLGGILFGQIDGFSRGTIVGQDILDALSAIGESMRSYLSQTADAPSRVLYLLSAEGHVATPDTYEGKLLELLGFENAAEEGSAYLLTEEQLENCDAEILWNGGLTEEQLAENPVYGALSAVENGNVLTFDQKIIDRRGNRTVLLFSDLLQELFPDAVIETSSTSSEDPISSSSASQEGEADNPAETSSSENAAA